MPPNLLGGTFVAGVVLRLGRDAKTVKNRVHLDLRPYPGDDQAAEVARLRALGATDIDVSQGDVPWTCLADPEDNEFCVLWPGLTRSLDDAHQS